MVHLRVTTRIPYITVCKLCRLVVNLLFLPERVFTRDSGVCRQYFVVQDYEMVVQ